MELCSVAAIEMRLPLTDEANAGPQHVPSDIHRPDNNPNGLILESWSQGLIVGSLVAMAAIAVSNMRRGVLLHKLILLEVRWQEGNPLLRVFIDGFSIAT